MDEKLTATLEKIQEAAWTRAFWGPPCGRS